MGSERSPELAEHHQRDQEQRGDGDAVDQEDRHHFAGDDGLEQVAPEVEQANPDADLEQQP